MNFGPDRIYGWGTGADLIDVSAIDAKSASQADDTFSYVGGAAYDGVGQLRFVTDGTDGFVVGDVDGDGVNDMVIILVGRTTALTADDFIL